MTIAYYSGSFISNLNFQLESAVFTTILVEDGRIFFLKEHLERLKQHLKQLNISNKLIDAKTLLQLIEKNSASTGIWRLKVSVNKSSLLATLQKEPLQLKQIRLNLYPLAISSKYPKLKTSDNFKRKALLEFSKTKGYDDCIVFDLDQNILETAVANIFWIKSNTLYYPDQSLPYLHGITLKFVIKLAKKMNMKTQAGFFKFKHLENAAVFYCNSMKKILLVEKIQGISIKKDLKIHAKLIKCFENYSFV